MRILPKLILFFVFLVFLFVAVTFSIGAELIEPSRTLEGQQKPMGRLTVYSEPPELDVLLDDINIGKTPVISKQVATGTHVLRIKETEKEIVILPETSLGISYCKDSLIGIPEKKIEVPTPPKPKEQPKIPEKKTEDSKKEKKQLDPFYFPTNPSGPIR